MGGYPSVRNTRSSVWTVTTKPFKEAHFATFPPDLILPCVLTSRKDAVILDPFFGSGTTGMVAVQNGRNYVGIDLNEKYCEMAKKRINKSMQEMEAF
jgi:DNA modification methylase